MTGDRGEAVPMSLDAHVAVQTVELRHVRETVERIEGQMGGHVARSEWEGRNGYVDGMFAQTHSKIQAVEDEMKAQRAPWWVGLGAGLGVLGALVTLITVVKPA